MQHGYYDGPVPLATDEESCVPEEAAWLPGARRRSAHDDAASAQKGPGMKPSAEEDCEEEVHAQEWSAETRKRELKARTELLKRAQQLLDKAEKLVAQWKPLSEQAIPYQAVAPEDPEYDPRGLSLPKLFEAFEELRAEAAEQAPEEGSMPMLSDAWERVVERIGRRGALIEALVHHMNATFGISQDPRWPGVVRRIVERSSGHEARVRFVRYPTHQRFLKAMAAGDQQLDGRTLTRLWLEHPLARRWKACTDDPESTDPALFNLALAVRRDFALPTTPTGKGETNDRRNDGVRGKKRTRAGQTDQDQSQLHIERFLAVGAADVAPHSSQ